MSLSRFAKLSDGELVSLQSKHSKPETEKCYVKNVNLFLKYLQQKKLTEDSILTVPISEIKDIALSYLSTARKSNGTFFKQSSFLQIKWALKKFMLEKRGYNIDCDPRLHHVVRNIQQDIIKSGRGGVKHHAAMSSLNLVAEASI